VALLRTYGQPIDCDPVSAILGELAHCAGHVAWLRARVQAAAPDDLTDTAAPWLALYAGERDRLVQMCRAAHAMGIEERRVVLAGQLGTAVAEFVRALLSDLDLTPDQAEAARLAVPVRLRALTAAAVG
jgi:hypothetical protein